MNFKQNNLQENELNQQESLIIDDTNRVNVNYSNQSDQTILSQQQFQKYLEKLKEIYNSILSFVEDDESNQIYFEDLIININKEQYDQNREDFKHFLLLLASIFNNHHHNEIFDKKIFQIILYYGDKIKQAFSNLEIYFIFQNNKKILLFLIENKIMQFEESIYKQIKANRFFGKQCCHFFYPEIKEFIGKEKVKSIENELLSNDPNIFCDFNKKRHIGENDSYICSLIRQDSVETFISYVTKKTIPLNATIKSSIFETNIFLLKRKDISLIEYSAFFGAIQIFQYLRMNGVELTSSLWLFAIHSQNAELIHLLEYHEVNPQHIYDAYSPQNKYEDPFIESIGCHHNSIAHYIEDNLAPLCKKKLNYSRLFSYIFNNHNYEFFQNDFNDDKFYDINKYNYNKLADLYIKEKEEKLEEEIKKEKIDLLYAANKNKTKIIYYLLSKQNEIKHNCFAMCQIEKIVIPPTIESIGNRAFYCCRNLHEIIIPSSIKSIGKNAFSKCNFDEITIPSSVQSIGNGAFYGCWHLSLNKFPASITSIGDDVFRDCQDMTLNSIPSTITSIGNSSFRGCNNLFIISIPTSVTSIGNDTFRDCRNLNEIIIPSSVISIGNNVITKCKSLKKFVIPSSMTSIGKYFFSECTSLENIFIPQSVTIIGSHAFNNCSSLKKVQIPSSVTSIKDHAFYKCSSLLEITIPSSITSIMCKTFYECLSLNKIIIPESVTSICEFAFYRCSSLKQITLPSLLESIGNYAFSYCSSLSNISIPSSVKFVGDYAFFGCYSLSQKTIPSTVISIGKNIFE